MQPTPHNNKSSGFSLIEMVIVIVILGIISAIFAQVLGQQLKAALVSAELSELTPQARLPMERLARELRNAQDSQVVITSSTSIRFKMLGSSPIPTVEYRLNGTSLERKSSAGDSNWHPIARNASQNNGNAIFTLLNDASSDGLCAQTIIEYKITSASGIELPLRSSIYLRNYNCT
ncbi:MAG: prepilin-type N-terminal cleavage/methylation domain-containing protein [Gammaproteobacteria bacterium]|nr:prepilin-type N-terminal cleavage/methylation domain-containing protein [Gammaproteobacteria bacterium]